MVVIIFDTYNSSLTSGPSATPNHIHQGQFALDVKAKVLPLYEKVFDIEYPLPKLDTLGKDFQLRSRQLGC
jgi:hypothetical protein